MIEIVCCTQRSADEFWSQSPLGISLTRIGDDSRVRGRLFAANKQGLSVAFNQAIDADDSTEILVFIHDDVWLDDFFFFDRIVEGLAQFEVIGVAGSDGRLPGQPGWAFEPPSEDGELRWKTPELLSGAVAHGEGPFGSVSYYGKCPRRVAVLDGVLIAARKAALRSRSVRFDDRFEFHFYDMDFCRTAVEAGLTLGTWPIAVTHQSGGNFGSPEWNRQYHRYLEKWGD